MLPDSVDTASVEQDGHATAARVVVSSSEIPASKVAISVKRRHEGPGKSKVASDKYRHPNLENQREKMEVQVYYTAWICRHVP